MTDTVLLPVFVAWPSTFMTELVKRSLNKLDAVKCVFYDTPEDFKEACRAKDCKVALQWSTYDNIEHEMSMKYSVVSPSHPLIVSSSYVIRKALIRKHFLHQTINNYTTKHPESVLTRAVPRTWAIDIAYADELDELWADELYELKEIMDRPCKDPTWWILKPGMSDRGMGIRLFQTQDDLQCIFEKFDEGESEDDASSSQDATTILTSQLRHFVIQEYERYPLLLNPSDSPSGPGPLRSNRLNSQEQGRLGTKFHLRVYCVVSGTLSVYMCSNILALFAPSPYGPLIRSRGVNAIDPDELSSINLAPHLTNTCLQNDVLDPHENVRLLSEMIDCPTYSSSPGSFSTVDFENVTNQVQDVLAEVFQAAIASPIHFQPLPNAFEVFGVDFLVSRLPDARLRVKLLEFNAEPAMELTGPRLGWILEDLFIGITKLCVNPLLPPRRCSETSLEDVLIGETRYSLRKCLSCHIRDPDTQRINDS